MEWISKLFWLTANTVSIIMLIFLFQDLREPPVVIVAGATSSREAVVDSTHLGLVNKLRLSTDLTALDTDANLTALANARANDMVARQYFSHINPDNMTFDDLFPIGTTIPEYSCENLSLSYSQDPEVIVEGWKNSPGHNRCMVDPRMKNAGYATREYGISFDADNRPRMHYLVVAVHGS